MTDEIPEGFRVVGMDDDGNYHLEPWPADPVPSAESGSSTTPPSHGQEPGVCPIRQEQGLGDFQIRLLAALTAQTQAMLGLTSRIDRLIDAMSEGEDMDPDALPTAYLDGSPIR